MRETHRVGKKAIKQIIFVSLVVVGHLMALSISFVEGTLYLSRVVTFMPHVSVAFIIY